MGDNGNTITTYAVYECEGNGNNVTLQDQLVSVENIAREDPAMTDARLKNEAKRLANIQDGCEFRYLTADPLAREIVQRSSIRQPKSPPSSKTRHLLASVWDFILGGARCFHKETTQSNSKNSSTVNVEWKPATNSQYNCYDYPGNVIRCKQK